MDRLKLFAVIFAVVVTVQAGAQEEYLVEPFMPATPLCSSTVTHILQDSKGFMWFGTPDGPYYAWEEVSEMLDKYCLR